MTTTTWTNTAGGDFNTATNWTDGVPLAGDTALITASGTYTVTDNATNSIGTLEMASGATLAIAPGQELDVTSGTKTGALDGAINMGGSDLLAFGTTASKTKFNNAGAISTLSAGAELEINGTVTLVRDGTISLGEDCSITDEATGATLINGNSSSGNTISGDGNLESGTLSFVNGAKGVVDATGDDLEILTESFKNSGLVEATGTGSLDVASDITQTAAGKIKALGSSTIVLAGVKIVGGTVSIADGSKLVANTTSSIDVTKAITNAGAIEADTGDLFITGSVTNASTGELIANNGHTLDISGTLTGGIADIEGGPSALVLGGPSSESVIFGSSSPGILILGDAKKFTGTVAGMLANPTASIDLENIAWADGPTVNFNTATHVLTVTDPVKRITDKINISGPAGTFKATEAADTSTLITDPSANTAGASNRSAQLLAQSMASFGANGGIAGSGTASVPEHHTSSDFLAANSHHG